MRFICVILLCLTFQTLYSNAQVYRIELENDSANYRYTYWYNENGQKTMEVKQRYVGTALENVSQKEWSYTAGLCVSETQREWANGGWMLKDRFDYVYNGNELLETAIHVSFDENQNEQYQAKHGIVYTADEQIDREEQYAWMQDSWVLQSTVDYTYDQQKCISKVISQPGSPLYKIDYSYNETNKPYRQVVQQYVDGEWLNEERYSTYYNVDGEHIDLLRKELWQKQDYGFAWVNSEQTTYTYSPDYLLLSEIYQNWETSFWGWGVAYHYTYENGKIKSKTYSVSLYNDWRNMFSVQYDYIDSQEFLLQADAAYEYWGGQEGMPYTTFIPFAVNGVDISDVQYANYLEITGDRLSTIVPNMNSEYNTRVYPNPSDGIFYLEGDEIAAWILYSLNGQKITSSVQAGMLSMIDLSSLANGIYLLEVYNNETIEIHKIIKH